LFQATGEGCEGAASAGEPDAGEILRKGGSACARTPQQKTARFQTKPDGFPKTRRLRRDAFSARECCPIV